MLTANSPIFTISHLFERYSLFLSPGRTIKGGIEYAMQSWLESRMESRVESRVQSRVESSEGILYVNCKGILYVKVYCM